jgi:hypothetical protein
VIPNQNRGLLLVDAVEKVRFDWNGRFGAT